MMIKLMKNWKIRKISTDENIKIFIYINSWCICGIFIISSSISNIKSSKIHLSRLEALDVYNASRFVGNTSPF